MEMNKQLLQKQQASSVIMKAPKKFMIWTDDENLIVSFHMVVNFIKWIFSSEDELMDKVMSLVNTGYKVQ